VDGFVVTAFFGSLRGGVLLDIVRAARTFFG
jgi:hypothetical protein